MESRPLVVRLAQTFRLRRVVFVLLATVLLTVIVAQQASDANTRHSYSASDYLTWLLRGEGAHIDFQGERPVPGSALLASLPKTLGKGEESVLWMDVGMTRVVIEQVEEGDTLFSVLQRHGVARKVALSAAHVGHAVAKRHGMGALTRSFQLGKLLKLTFDQNGQLASLRYPLDDARTLRVARGGTGAFFAEIEKMPLGAETKASVQSETKASEQPESKASEPSESTVSVPPESKASARSLAGVARTLPQATPLHVRDLFSGAARQEHDTVRPGDLLTTLLARHGVNQATAYQVAAGSQSVFNLARLIKPGQDVRIALDKEGQLVGVAYTMNADSMLWIMRQGNGPSFKPHVQKKQFETRLRRVAGTIDDEGSLFLAGKNAGLSHGMVGKLANLFEWDVDFARDIHAGDQFRVVYEAKYDQGRPVRDGEIVAAEFINQGRVLQVFRYVDPAGNVGYYDAKGQSIRKMFIRAPVDFTYISSVFTKQRLHPIFGFTRAHKGVDYAAPQGTPVRAAGAGRITFIGNRGDYGHFITIRHNDTYSTAYAHLSAFSRGLREGSQVKQGEVIGRVGATGAATGPHLHYEVRVNEVQVNPLSIQQITANPVLSRHAEDFRLKTGRSLAMLHTEEAPVAALPRATAAAN
ncbi:MAG: peptidoglycan DD-metalloendopeptidase family protein [Magnetococcales bacterium]|nr:peptidoglycan DD-metalloendopeptidase family protein [Magnetococcales bacterium]